MISCMGEISFPTEVPEIGDRSLCGAARTYRVALLIPLCGSAGLWAPSCISSAQVAVRELNRGDGITGRPVELVMVDAAVEAPTPVEAVVHELIEAGAIDAIVGMHISAVRQRLSKVVGQRVPYVYTPLYEGGEQTAGIFAIGETPDAQLGPALQYLQTRFRPRSWALIGNDYVWPRTSHAYAKAKLREMSANLAFERYLPFGLRNMDRHVDEIATSGAEAVLISLVGQDAVAFNRAFGMAGLDKRIVRLSCAVEENGLLASGGENLKRLFSAASYFGALPTEANGAFKEKYYSLHGEHAPVLNAIGQSTYEGVHFLAGLLGHDNAGWREAGQVIPLTLDYRSARRERMSDDGKMRTPIYLARADGVQFSVIKRI